MNYKLITINSFYFLVREFFCAAAGIVGDNLAGAQQLPFVNHKAFQANRAAGVYLIGADTHFGAKAVAEAIAKTSAAVPEYVRRIDQVHKLGGLFLVGGNNGVGVAGAEMVYMLDGLVETGHDFYGEDIIQVLG